MIESGPLFCDGNLQIIDSSSLEEEKWEMHYRIIKFRYLGKGVGGLDNS